MICYGHDYSKHRFIKLFAWRRLVNGEMIYAPKETDIDMSKVKDGSLWKVILGKTVGEKSNGKPPNLSKISMRTLKMKKYKLDHYEVRIIILALNELRNQLIQEGRYTDAVDELLIKLLERAEV